MKWHDRSANIMSDAWNAYVTNLEKSLEQLDEDINEAAAMKDACTDEWCAATEHVLDDLHKSVFSIHEPTFTSKEQSEELKRLKRKLHDVYANFRQAAAA